MFLLQIKSVDYYKNFVKICKYIHWKVPFIYAIMII